jgi:hypothetical protein
VPVAFMLAVPVLGVTQGFPVPLAGLVLVGVPVAFGRAPTADAWLWCRRDAPALRSGDDRSSDWACRGGSCRRRSRSRCGRRGRWGLGCRARTGRARRQGRRDGRCDFSPRGGRSGYVGADCLQIQEMGSDENEADRDRDRKQAQYRCGYARKTAPHVIVPSGAGAPALNLNARDRTSRRLRAGISGSGRPSAPARSSRPVLRRVGEPETGRCC